MATFTHLLIRTIHVVGMALLLGGAASAWMVLRETSIDPLELALRFEWAFWVVLGLLVVTGIGNLGALGAPGPGTDWGRILLLKLLLVLAFVVGSVIRTLAVVRVEAQVGRATHLRGWLQRVYGTTAATLLVIVVLGEVLAHG